MSAFLIKVTLSQTAGSMRRVCSLASGASAERGREFSVLTSRFWELKAFRCRSFGAGPPPAGFCAESLAAWPEHYSGEDKAKGRAAKATMPPAL